MQKYLLPLMVLCGTVAGNETLRYEAIIWQFEDHYYIACDGHLYYVDTIEHSDNCGCRD